MIESKRRHLLKGYWLLVGCGAVIMVAALYLMQKTDFHLLEMICKYAAISSGAIVGIMILICGLRIVFCGGIKQYILRQRLLRKIEQNLLSIGAYQKRPEITYAVLPKIKIKKDQIIIDLSDMVIRDKIVKSIDLFSTALVGAYVV